MKAGSQKPTGLGYFAAMWLLRVLIIFVLPLATFAYFEKQPPVLVSPSHPFVDDNQNGIDDFEENTGTYSDPEQKAKIFGITFPIPELGDCASYSQCFTYCEDPVNFQECVDYARQKGFYRDDELQTATDKFWQDAKDELGCDSLDSCLAVCRDPANYDKCDAFAKKKGVVGGYIEEPDKPEFLQIAKEVLGCDSAASCANFCDDPANTQKCTDFANQVGLLGGTLHEGPGGCTSESTCQSYCLDPNNFEQCSKYVPPGTTGFRGPGDCDSPQSCRSYCEQNPETCRSYAPGASGHYVPMACGENEYFGPGGVCTALGKSQDAEKCFQDKKYWNGQSCEEKPPPGISISSVAYFQPRTDMGNCQTPGECYDWCKANPGQCAGFNPEAPRPNENYQPPTYYQSPPGGYTSPYPGTYSPSSPDTYTPGTYYPPSGSYTQPYSGSEYQPPPSGSYTPPSDSGSYTPPSDSGSYTPPSDSGSGIQGTKTAQSLLERILNFLSSLFRR